MNMINISVAGGVPSPVEGACGALTIGNVGDNGATGVLLDFSAWAEEYGAGAVTLGVRRKGDAAWYPVALTVTGAAAVWIVSNIDTAVYGIGEARFAYAVGEVEKRSAVFRFFVDRGLGAPEGTPPDPYEDWVERLEDLGAETLQNAQDAAASAAEAQGYARDAETAKNAAESAQEAAEGSQKDAEAWAVGERGGEPVQPGDPAYHNNAKYWADEAHADAPVTSVNGQTGAVTLDAEDVGALPGSSTLDDIQDGETYKRATEAQLQQISANTEAITTKQPKITAAGLLKGDGSGGVSAAVAGTDYVPPSALTPYRTAAAQDVIDALLGPTIPGTMQTVTFDANGQPQSIVHSDGSAAVRTDVFTWTSNSVAEIRTLATGEQITIATNLVTLVTVISDIQEAV